MRLIDADALIELIDEGFDLNFDEVPETKRELIRMIGDQPTINTESAQRTGRAIDARRYTFGNDEFSLEAAYHDCKMVFDGITDDDSFQEADTGLILYYANEIIYALQEALGKDTNVVRCKECQHLGEYLTEEKTYPNWCMVNQQFVLHPGNWFCADGERRADDA